MKRPSRFHRIASAQLQLHHRDDQIFTFHMLSLLSCAAGEGRRVDPAAEAACSETVALLRAKERGCAIVLNSVRTAEHV